MSNSLETRPLGADARIGREVLGVDLAGELSDSRRADIYELWLEHGLLLFSAQRVNPETQVRFSALFGELEVHPLVRSKENRYLFVLDSADTKTNPINYFDGEPLIGRLHWHKDLVYTAKPNRGAVLCAMTMDTQRGETGFADQAAAHDSLDDETKARIEELEVRYRFDVVLANMRFMNDPSYAPGPESPQSIESMGYPKYPDSIYPLALRHPETGRRILNVCELFMHEVCDMPRAQGDPLLRRLLDHLLRPEHIYTHRWRLDQMILWDNWRFAHCASGIQPGEQRLVNRTTISGKGEALGRVAA